MLVVLRSIDSIHLEPILKYLKFIGISIFFFYRICLYTTPLKMLKLAVENLNRFKLYSKLINFLTDYKHVKIKKCK